MRKQLPVESEGLGPLVGDGFAVGVVSGVNDESGCLVEDFKPTIHELDVLARQYLIEARIIEFDSRFLGMGDSYGIRMRPFAYRRLATIENVLGEERFQEAITRTVEEWDRKFAEAEEIERNLEPCKQCGGKRDYYDYAFPSILEGYCGACKVVEPGEKAPNSPQS